MPSAPTPRFYVPEDHKEAMAEQFVAQLIFSMEHLQTEPNAPLADDFIDIVARVVAITLAADTHLSTPAKLRMGAETVAAHVLRHVKRYRAEEQETGESALNRVLVTNEIPEEMKQAWNDS